MKKRRNYILQLTQLEAFFNDETLQDLIHELYFDTTNKIAFIRLWKEASEGQITRGRSYINQINKWDKSKDRCGDDYWIYEGHRFQNLKHITYKMPKYEEERRNGTKKQARLAKKLLTKEKEKLQATELNHVKSQKDENKHEQDRNAVSFKDWKVSIGVINNNNIGRTIIDKENEHGEKKKYNKKHSNDETKDGQEKFDQKNQNKKKDQKEINEIYAKEEIDKAQQEKYNQPIIMKINEDEKSVEKGRVSMNIEELDHEKFEVEIYRTNLKTNEVISMKIENKLYKEEQGKNRENAMKKEDEKNIASQVRINEEIAEIKVDDLIEIDESIKEVNFTQTLRQEGNLDINDCELIHQKEDFQNSSQKAIGNIIDQETLNIELIYDEERKDMHTKLLEKNQTINFENQEDKENDTKSDTEGSNIKEEKDGDILNLQTKEENAETNIKEQTLEMMDNDKKEDLDEKGKEIENNEMMNYSQGDELLDSEKEKPITDDEKTENIACNKKKDDIQLNTSNKQSLQHMTKSANSKVIEELHMRLKKEYGFDCFSIILTPQNHKVESKRNQAIIQKAKKKLKFGEKILHRLSNLANTFSFTDLTILYSIEKNNFLQNISTLVPFQPTVETIRLSIKQIKEGCKT